MKKVVYAEDVIKDLYDSGHSCLASKYEGDIDRMSPGDAILLSNPDGEMVPCVVRGETDDK